MIVEAPVSSAAKLTALTLLSKAFWGYRKEELASWQDELYISSEMVAENHTYLFLINNTIAGFYLLKPPCHADIELEFLFVHPTFIRQGVGKQLIEHAFHKAISLGCARMLVLADPNAEGFYQQEGFELIERKESRIFNRFLPWMKKELVLPK